jgi:hypothetical protein
MPRKQLMVVVVPWVLVLSAVIGWAPLARADLPTVPVYNDLWDISQGTTVIAHSPCTENTDAVAIFGGTYGSWEPNNVLFEDYHSPPYVHWVEWQTPSPVAIGAFNLAAAADSTDDTDPSYCRRSFSHFRLYAWGGTAFQMVFDAAPPLPYPGKWNLSDGMPFSIILSTPITSNKWRAEFDQQVWTHAYGEYPAGFYGPRIVELDGFAPEPATFSLFALGRLAMLRHRRSSY